MTDQQRADHLSCSGNQILKTPNLDQLANEGVRFTHAYCSNPMCMPNRATIFTGKYPSIHHVRCNGINLDSQIPTITQCLSENGYHTISIGKMHFQYSVPAYSRKSKSEECVLDWIIGKRSDNFPLPYYGFNEVELTVGHGDGVVGNYLEWIIERAPEYAEYIKKRTLNTFKSIYHNTKIPNELYQTTYITERTTNFLERYSNGNYGNKPFFLFCSFPDPHHPVCPPDKYKKLYNESDIPIPSTFSDFENLLNHEFLGANLRDPNFNSIVLRNTNEEETKKFTAYTYATLTAIDHGVGEIIKTLKKLGLEKDTMIIFTSDHGDLMGDHGMLLKGPAHFQGVLRVPLIWKVPGFDTNKVSSSIVSSIDIPTTILSLIGIKKLQGMQGVDLTPILKDPSMKVRDHCIVEEDEDLVFERKKSYRLRTLITENYRMTLYRDHENFGDLFDLKNDPNEVNNLWRNDNYTEVKNNLMKTLLHEIIKIQDEFPKRQALT